LHVIFYTFYTRPLLYLLYAYILLCIVSTSVGGGTTFSSIFTFLGLSFVPALLYLVPIDHSSTCSYCSQSRPDCTGYNQEFRNLLLIFRCVVSCSVKPVVVRSVSQGRLCPPSPLSLRSEARKKYRQSIMFIIVVTVPVPSPLCILFYVTNSFSFDPHSYHFYTIYPLSIYHSYFPLPIPSIYRIARVVAHRSICCSPSFLYLCAVFILLPC
jgi:hypothetical protein